MSLPAGVSIRRLTKPTADELDKLANVSNLAFGPDDSIAKAACGADPALMVDFHRCSIAACAVGGNLFVASYEDPSNIVGCVAFFGPGTEIMGDEEQRKQGFNDFVVGLPADVQKWWFEKFLPDYSTAGAKVVSAKEKQEAWSVNFFAVLPDYQGKGIGKALLATGEALAKAAGERILMDAETHNTGMYEHFGYKPLGRVELDMGSFVGTMVLNFLEKDFRPSA